MKFTIDTDLKKVTIQNGTVQEIVDKLKQILSKEEFKNYKFETEVVNNWGNPYINVPTITFGETNDYLKPPFEITCGNGIFTEDWNLENSKIN